MSELHMQIDETLLDDDGEWPDLVTFEVPDGETEDYIVTPEGVSARDTE